MPNDERGRRGGDTYILRLVVLGCALATTVLKVTIAAHTFGTDDVHYWIDFARGARQYGPVRMYGEPFIAPYNHPPLIGWMLVLLGWLTDHGASFQLLIRLPASFADIASALLVFELVRRRRGTRAGTLAGVLVALSPLLVIVSGFHGNTDPVFVALSLLTLYLVAVADRPLGAGVAFGLAVSVKLVPVVILPLLIVMLLQRGVRPLGRFAAGGAIIFVLLWVSVLALRPSQFIHQVLLYKGIGFTQWGIPQFMLQFGATPHAYATFINDTGLGVLLVAALLPAALVWRRPTAWLPAAGLAFALFLLLSPAFGMQYLVWPLAASYLVGGGTATLYNLATGIFAWRVYSDWSGGGVWGWHEAHGAPFSPPAMGLMVVAWSALLLVVYEGFKVTWLEAAPELERRQIFTQTRGDAPNEVKASR